MGSSYVILNFLSSVFFILGIKMLSSPVTARRGNLISFSGMVIAIITTPVSYTHLTLPTNREV